MATVTQDAEAAPPARQGYRVGARATRRPRSNAAGGKSLTPRLGTPDTRSPAACPSGGPAGTRSAPGYVGGSVRRTRASDSPCRSASLRDRLVHINTLDITPSAD
jgi:hypothetical protein